MNSSDERLNNLFRSAKEAPLELDLNEIESIVTSFDSLDEKPDGGGNDWSILKKLLIIGLPLLTLLLTFLYTNRDLPKVEPIVQSVSAPVMPTASFSSTNSLQETKQEVEAGLSESLASIGTLEDTDVLPDLLSPKQVVVPIVPQTAEVQEASIMPQPIENLTSTLEPAKSSFHRKSIQGTPLPVLSDEQLRDLKESLLSSLYTDELIFSETETIFVQLPGSHIAVNDIRLEEGITAAYTALTSAAGYGEHRGIEISPDHILVGDFVDGKFEGSRIKLTPPTSTAVTMTVESEVPEEPIAIQAEDAIGSGEAWDNLNAFAEEVLAKAPVQHGKKRLNPVELSDREMSLLYEMLQNQLRKDRLISSSADYVILGLGDRAITFNGKELTPDKFLTYRAILKVHNIKNGARRMVCMNDIVMGVGDFKSREFKGTIWTVTK